MASSKVSSTRALVRALEQVIPAIKAPENMKKYGEQAAAMIKLRTRLGQGVSKDGADKQALKPLAESTVESRKNAKKKGKLSGETSAKKSNLTHTGQLLDSVQVVKAEYGKVSVGPKGSRSGGSTNEKVGEYVTEGGRPFNNLSKVEIKRLQDAVKKDLREQIKSRLTKR